MMLFPEPEKTWSLRSPAKINLHLEVLHKREDGYHALSSIFHMIDLYDEISLSYGTNGIQIDGCNDIEPEKNLVYKAACLFLDKAHDKKPSGNWQFTIKKNIPMGAGLGGGSSNAASALRLMNEACGTLFSKGELFQMGMSLGSDVGFFLISPAAYVTGRGEEIHAIPPAEGLSGLLIYPGIHTSTAEAFSRLARTGTYKASLDKNRVLEEYSARNFGQWSYFNDFLKVNDNKTIQDGLDIFKNASFKSLTGSGSSLFALYDHEDRLETDYVNGLKAFKSIWKIKMLVNLTSIVLEL